MKSFRLFLLLVSILSSIGVSAQHQFIQVNGHVKDFQTQLPVTNHQVVVAVHPDTTNTVLYSDTTITDDMGWYSFPASVPYYQDSVLFISVRTLDCMSVWKQHTTMSDGGLVGTTMDFDICNDAANPPSLCDNMISFFGGQGLTVYLAGVLYECQPATYLWSLGDGSSAVGLSVVHTYSQPGIYTFTLQTITQDSCADLSNYTLDLTEPIPPTSCQNGITVNVQGTSVSYQGYMVGGSTASYYWSFGDGHFATGQSVTHSYAQKGFYNVFLRSVTSNGCVSYSGYPLALIDSLNPVQCDNYILPIEVNGLTIGLHGNLYNGQSASYFWNMGDGTTASTQYVTHTYTAPGTYTVSLQTVTTNGSCMANSTAIISLTDSSFVGCTSYFTYSNGISAQETNFQGYSTSQFPTMFSWDFGDPFSGVNNTSNLQNPVHVFAFPGTYTVLLTTSDSTGCSFVYPATVVILPGGCQNSIVASNIHNLTMSFAGSLNNGQPASYFWNLGDGTSSSSQSLTHTYAQPGYYTVLLRTITADSCIDSTYYSVQLIDSIPAGCNGCFTANAGNMLYNIHFAGFTSSTYPTTFSWNFGDPASGINNTSALQNPDHTFSSATTYSVTLTTVDSANCSNTFTAPVILSMYNEFSLYGKVFAGSQSITQCNIQLFGEDNLGNMILNQEKYPDSADFYKFDSVSSGIYLIRAIPAQGSVYAQQYLPTYFGDAFLWENATPIVLGQPVNPYLIHLVEFDSIGGGDGMINGELISGGKTVATGYQEILILNMNNIPVRCIFSQPDGSFAFAGLPYGEYKVYPVITGISTYPVTVELTASNNSATVVMKISGKTIYGINEIKKADLIEKIFPNPATNEIVVSVKFKGIINFQIVDATGKIVLSGEEIIPIEGSSITIPLNDINPGLYMIRVRDEKGNVSSGRFIRTR